MELTELKTEHSKLQKEANKVFRSIGEEHKEELEKMAEKITNFIGKLMRVSHKITTKKEWE